MVCGRDAFPAVNTLSYVQAPEGEEDLRATLAFTGTDAGSADGVRTVVAGLKDEVGELG